MLPTTDHRDSEGGQVVLRYAKDSDDSDLNESPKMIMVDQLWLWVIPRGAVRLEPPQLGTSKSSKQYIVISAFPQRWKQDPNDKLNLTNLDFDDLNNSLVKSALDLVSTIVAKCCDVFDRSLVPKDLQFFEFFENSIGSIVSF
jgi:hypothetical protein